MLKASASKLDITPPVGVELSGYVARIAPSTGVHKPLYARTVLLQSGATKCAIISADIVGFSRKSVERIRSSIQDRTGIPSENIMLAGTHTHSGPATLKLRECGEISPDYLRYLEKRVVELVELASQNLCEVLYAHCYGKASIALNRRRHDFEPGDDPDSEKCGLVDRTVNALSFRNADGEFVGTILNYACHAVVLGADNLLISPDYPGVATELLERELGGVALFFNGACGNINPIKRGSFDYADEAGRTIGEEALKCLKASEFIPTDTLKVRSETLALPLMSCPSQEELKEELQRYRQELRLAQDENNLARIKQFRAMVLWVEEMLDALPTGSVPDRAIAELQLINIGDVCLVGVPGELFVELGLRIKELLPSKHIFVIGYANGCIGYIPTDSAIEEGGYEPSEAARYYGSLPLAKGTEELVVEGIRKLLSNH